MDGVGRHGSFRVFEFGAGNFSGGWRGGGLRFHFTQGTATDGRRVSSTSGPIPLPLVGNLFGIDAKKPWMTYAEWATRYGDIFMIRLLKQDMIVINSKKIAKDLLDRRSRIYSDRPYLATRDPFGWSFNFAWSQYRDEWRSQRRMFHQAFRAEAALDLGYLVETLRMYPVVPLAIPHGTTADDIYEDIFIPKGSAVVPNIWAMHHNEDDYPEPDVFKPERLFVDERLNGDKSIDSLAFGFGRRVCPGRYTADSSIWIAIVSILYAFKITKALDEQGKELDFEPSFSSGVTTCPDPFPCSITPLLLNIDIHKLSAEDV